MILFNFFLAAKAGRDVKWDPYEHAKQGFPGKGTFFEKIQIRRLDCRIDSNLL